MLVKNQMKKIKKLINKFKKNCWPFKRLDIKNIFILLLCSLAIMVTASFLLPTESTIFYLIFSVSYIVLWLSFLVLITESLIRIKEAMAKLVSIYLFVGIVFLEVLSVIIENVAYEALIRNLSNVLSSFFAVLFLTWLIKKYGWLKTVSGVLFLHLFVFAALFPWLTPFLILGVLFLVFKFKNKLRKRLKDLNKNTQIIIGFFLIIFVAAPILFGILSGIYFIFSEVIF